MENNSLTVLLFLSLLGVALTAFNNQKKPIETQKQSWIKLGVYILIITVILLAIFSDSRFFKFICIMILGVTGAEILRLVILTAKIGTGIFSLFVLGVLAFGFIQFSALPRAVIYYTFFITVVFDSFSQLIGQLLGKRKILKIISPNKTWAGFLGGMVAAGAIGYVIGSIIDLKNFSAVSIGVTIGLFAFLGDVLASACKRKFGVKDFSRIIPGHGGFGDRFDSFISSGSAMFMMSYFFLL